MMGVHLADRSALYAAYMPFVENGGLFIPSDENYALGEEVFVLLRLLDEPDKWPLAGKVIWKNPKGSVGNRTPGIGVQFKGADGERLHARIEALLAGSLDSDKATYTI
jgi:type IV pilus assembly protein PilZ